MSRLHAWLLTVGNNRVLWPIETTIHWRMWGAIPASCWLVRGRL